MMWSSLINFALKAMYPYTVQTLKAMYTGFRI